MFDSIVVLGKASAETKLKLGNRSDNTVPNPFTKQAM